MLFIQHYGVPGGIRTPDLLVRSQSLYPAELQAHHPLTISIISQLFLIVNTFFRKRNILYFLEKLNKIYMQIAET